jgi:chaperonin GroES
MANRRSVNGKRFTGTVGPVPFTLHRSPFREPMDFPPKQLLVVGDRVLIAPEDGDDRTRVGLYLPATAIDSQQVQTGLIVATGPGTAIPDLSTLDEEPWKVDQREGRTRGMQARVGDHAIFFRKAAVEITFEEKRYLVVPQAAILVLVRDDLPI